MVDSRPDPRLVPGPMQIVDRSRVVAFEFDGGRVQAYQGDTVASALYAVGLRTFSRSFKFHRSRGLLCMAGRCPNCLMTVDGVPNVRTCTEPVRTGMRVRHQNAWPSLDRDMLSILDKLDWLMPVGFYYKAMYRPRWLWRLASPIIRRVAGLGSVDTVSMSSRRYEHEHLHADVAVIGGGPAGMSAALAAAEAGARVVLVDDQPSLGGHLRYDATTHEALPGLQTGQGFQIAEELARAVNASDRIEVIADAVAFGLYEGNLLGVHAGPRLIKLRARNVVMATGSDEQPLTFDRNDLPGVMLGTGLQRLTNLQGVRPGSTALIATGDDHGYTTALDLMDAGMRVAALADSRPAFPSGLEAARTLQSRGVLILTAHALTQAEGIKRVVGGIVSRLVDGRRTTEQRQFDCDVIAMSGGFRPVDWLLAQAGSGSAYDDELGGWTLGKLPEGLHAAGGVAGSADLRLSIAQGRAVGTEAASGVSGPTIDPSPSPRVARTEPEPARTANQRPRSPNPGHTDHPRGPREFVCFCEDVTAGDIARAIDEGFEDIQTLKRYSTVTMGPCQGKMCLGAFAAVCATRLGRTAGEIGVTTARPPVRPVPLGALAGLAHVPVKRTSIDGRHRDLGAQMTDIGTWQRPHHYGPPQQEALAVRNRVGIIDVGTLGKLDVVGRDVPALLDKLYTHHFSTLRPGRIRYGVLCSDNGTILDDGTVTRLADDHYFVTTSTANVDVIEEWFKWWSAGTGWCAHVTNVTAHYAAINVAGPRARDTLTKLTDVDLSPKAFRYMRSGRGDVAGVPCLFLRIGFVGETGWELHFPAEYGEYMWDTLMEAGEEFGIAPFGVEAQRILRLEKKHLIPGQDTDILTNPLDADSEWVVRFDKDDFIGMGGLIAARDRGIRNKLVGFVVRNGEVPNDGDAVVANGSPIGRVTSARLSPTLGKGFGLAWVPIDLAQEGQSISIHTEGRDVPADVTLRPVYDPEGKRLRE